MDPILSMRLTLSIVLSLSSQPYASSQAWWDQVREKKDEWYSSAVSYWDDQTADNEGVLGGFGQVSPADIMDSRRFLVKSLSERLERVKHQTSASEATEGSDVQTVTQESPAVPFSFSHEATRDFSYGDVRLILQRSSSSLVDTASCNLLLFCL